MKILVVDDDRITRLLLRKILAKEPAYEVTEAGNGVQAWNLFDGGITPDLVVLDIMMPAMDGLQLLRKLRSDQRFKDLKVMMCTVVADANTIHQANELGIDHYLIKPFSAQGVLEQVRKVFAKMPGSEPLEDLNIIGERLGIDRPSYLNLLNLMLEEAEKGIADMKTALARGDRNAVNWTISAIKDAGTNMGAIGLVSAAERIEAALPAAEPAQLEAGLQGFESEYRRLVAWVNQLSKTGKFPRDQEI